MSAVSVKDPSREELLESLGKATTGAEVVDREAAIYWFATHYHLGQWSNLYRVLCESKYEPHPREAGAKEAGGSAGEMYDKLVNIFG